MTEYLAVLVLCGIAPFILSFWPSLKFYSNTKALFLSILMIVLTFGIWDVFAVYRKHWHFNPQYVCDFKLVNLPIEEILFFVVIPFCCIFTWEALKHIKDKLK